MSVVRRTALITAAAAVAAAGPAHAQSQQYTLPANDLNPILALTGTVTPPTVPTQSNPEPALKPVPAARCGPGSRPLAGEQGRVPWSAVLSADAKQGWTCNITPIGHLGGAGGFRTWRYTDTQGHECAYYDTALVHPGNATSLPGLPSTGVAVLDMSDPAHPVQTDLLNSLPMQMPHESLNVNQKRGLIAAEMGSGATAPGLMSIYDAHLDCRHPVEQYTGLLARFGHESGFSPDGKTFYIAGGIGIAAIDVTNPKVPIKLWEGNEYAHGLNLSRNGDRLYVADPIDGELTILDVSQIQARKPNPVVREVSRLTWKTVSIPQNSAPMEIDGHKYLLEFDEFAFRFNAIPQDLQQVGGARIIDIADEKHPRVVSNLRLAVNQHDEHLAAAGDPGALSPVQGYASHYCAIPREVDPEIVACSFINSGLRIFDIRDPRHPREAAYFVSPPTGGLSTLGVPTDFAMSMPSFVPERREVWYTDAISGFYALRLPASVWPSPTFACAPTRDVVLHLNGHPTLRRFSVTVDGKRVKARRQAGGGVRITLHNRRAGHVRVVLRAVTRAGRKATLTRRLKTCDPTP